MRRRRKKKKEEEEEEEEEEGKKKMQVVVFLLLLFGEILLFLSFVYVNTNYKYISIKYIITRRRKKKR